MTFTYNGTSTAAAFTAGVFNVASALADAKALQSTAEFAGVRSALAEIPAIPLAALHGQIPAAPPSATQSPLDLTTLLDSRAGILSGLVTDMDAFLATYFPGVDAEVSAARAALELMFTGNNFADGRTSARLRLEQAQARQMRSRDEAADALVRKYAARGFQQPSGPLLHEMNKLSRDDLYAVADQMFVIDQSEAAREAQNLMQAMSLLVDKRAKAMTAFSEYLGRACLARYDAEMAATESQFRYQEIFLSSLSESALGANRVAALQIRQSQSNYEISKDYLATLDRLVENQASATLTGARDYASLLGQQAAAAFNALQGRTGVSGSEQL